MDDAFWFFCGTVPFIFFHRPRPDPGPWPWLVWAAAGIGGVIAVSVFGSKYAADGATLSTFLVAFAGGAALGQVVDLARGMMGPNRA